MAMMASFMSVCCGEGEEEKRFGTVVDPNDYQEQWGNKRESMFVTGVKDRIKDVEHLINRMGRGRSLRSKKCLDANDMICTRKSLHSKPLDFTEHFEPPVYIKSDAEMVFLEKALDNNFIFMDLTDDERHTFVMAMEQLTVEQGGIIIQKGDIVGDYFYVVSRGQVDFIDDGQNVGHCNEGGSFGELALLYDSPRAVSCVAATAEVTLWRIDQKTFRHILARSSLDKYASIKEWLRGVDIFKGMDEHSLTRFAEALVTVRWKEGDRIVQKGEEGNAFYIVQEGTVKVHDIGLGDSQAQDQELGPGHFFGEVSLITGEPRVASVTAVTDVTTLALDRGTFENCIGPMRELLDFGSKRQFLPSNPLFGCGSLTDPELDQLARLAKEVCYKKGAKLAEPGKPYLMQTWFITKGRLIAYSTKNPDKIATLQAGDCFGDKSIRGDPNHISSHTAICEENLTTWVLTREDIESVIGDINRLGNPPNYKKTKHVNDILLDDLEKHRMLGSGAFGRVWLVTSKSDSEKKSPFALKSISKRKIISSQQVHSVTREKELLSTLHNPFILSLTAAYQDEKYLYLLLPVIPGGELFDQLQKRKTRRGGLPKNDAAFYAACIIEGLGHFHQRNIAYRDLKLENVMINEDGYLVIVDLGFAKIVPDKTYTLVGTPEYLAPEIIMSKGHDKSVDYWSFGVLVYELFVGQSPFYKRGTSQMDLFKRIVMVKYNFPECVNDPAASLIEKLLIRRPSNRLGNLANGYLDVKKHVFFETHGIDFKEIIKKEVQPPWIPESKNLFHAPGRDDFMEESYGPRLTKEEQDLFRDFVTGADYS